MKKYYIFEFFISLLLLLASYTFSQTLKELDLHLYSIIHSDKDPKEREKEEKNDPIKGYGSIGIEYGKSFIKSKDSSGMFGGVNLKLVFLDNYISPAINVSLFAEKRKTTSVFDGNNENKEYWINYASIEPGLNISYRSSFFSLFLEGYWTITAYHINDQSDSFFQDRFYYSYNGYHLSAGFSFYSIVFAFNMRNSISEDKKTKYIINSISFGIIF